MAPLSYSNDGLDYSLKQLFVLCDIINSSEGIDNSLIYIVGISVNKDDADCPKQDYNPLNSLDSDDKIQRYFTTADCACASAN